MLSENHVVVQMDHIHDILRVVLFQKLEDFELNSGLVIVLLLVFDNLDGDINSSLVIETFQSSSKRALPQERLNFKSEPNMVICDDLIIAFFIIIPKIVLKLGATLDLLSSWGTNKVDLRVV